MSLALDAARNLTLPTGRQKKINKLVEIMMTKSGFTFAVSTSNEAAGSTIFSGSASDYDLLKVLKDEHGVSLKERIRQLVNLLNQERKSLMDDDTDIYQVFVDYAEKSKTRKIQGPETVAAANMLLNESAGNVGEQLPPPPPLDEPVCSYCTEPGDNAFPLLQCRDDNCNKRFHRYCLAEVMRGGQEQAISLAYYCASCFDSARREI